MYSPVLRSHTHLQATQANAQTKACKRVCLPNRTDQATIDRPIKTEKERRTHNSTYKKLTVQWLSEAFVLRIEFCDGKQFALLNLQLLVALLVMNG